MAGIRTRAVISRCEDGSIHSYSRGGYGSHDDRPEADRLSLTGIRRGARTQALARLRKSQSNHEYLEDIPPLRFLHFHDLAKAIFLHTAVTCIIVYENIDEALKIFI